MKKRWLVWLLVVCMAMSQLPVWAHAEDAGGEGSVMLLEEDGEWSVELPDAAETVEPVAMGMLSYGSRGDRVQILQERLTQLGYYTFRITGNYQENTQRAVELFQADNGLAVTGKADAQLQALILSDNARPMPTPTPVPTLSPNDMAFDKKLTSGSVGPRVTLVQRKLSELGYYTIEVSGNYLVNTRRAVKAFQKKNGLGDSGEVDRATWDMLFFGTGLLDVAATPTPAPPPPPPPYEVYVDVTNQVVTVLGIDAAGEYSVPVRQMICSTGTVNDPTPQKTYTLNGAKARWCFFPKWGSHAQYWTRMSSAYAFHSVIYNSPNALDLAVGSYTALGNRASHGCIRLPVADAKWIYDNCGKDTKVIVYESGVKDPELAESLRPGPLDYTVMLPAQTPAPTLAPTYVPNAQPPEKYRKLTIGMKGEDVYFLQRKLADLGYYKGSITGGYYQGTRDAVRAFQKDSGLSVDGIAGKQTQQRLYVMMSATPSPAPTATPVVTVTPAPTAVPTMTAVPKATATSQAIDAPNATAKPSAIPVPSTAPTAKTGNGNG